MVCEDDMTRRKSSRGREQTIVHDKNRAGEVHGQGLASDRARVSNTEAERAKGFFQGNAELTGARAVSGGRRGFSGPANVLPSPRSEYTLLYQFKYTQLQVQLQSRHCTIRSRKWTGGDGK